MCLNELFQMILFHSLPSGLRAQHNPVFETFFPYCSKTGFSAVGMSLQMAGACSTWVATASPVAASFGTWATSGSSMSFSAGDARVAWYFECSRAFPDAAVRKSSTSQDAWSSVDKGKFCPGFRESSLGHLLAFRLAAVPRRMHATPKHLRKSL